MLKFRCYRCNGVLMLLSWVCCLGLLNQLTLEEPTCSTANRHLGKSSESIMELHLQSWFRYELTFSLLENSIISGNPTTYLQHQSLMSPGNTVVSETASPRKLTGVHLPLAFSLAGIPQWMCSSLGWSIDIHCVHGRSSSTTLSIQIKETGNWVPDKFC